MTSRNGSAISWTSYNYPSGVGTSTESATFDYGPDRQRWRMVYTGSAGIETTYYVTPLLDVVHTSSGTDCRNYVYAGGRPVMQLSRTSSYGAIQKSLLVDQQNSISTIVTDSSGAALVNESFTAFGNRREASTWTGTPTSTELTNMNNITRQGYTFQTVLGSMGLNHMNGRVEDSFTGRFLSPDPFTQDMGDTQNYNRYTYVLNNPLTYIDPSGFFCGGPSAVPVTNAGPNNETWIDDNLPIESATVTTACVPAETLNVPLPEFAPPPIPVVEVPAPVAIAPPTIAELWQSQMQNPCPSLKPSTADSGAILNETPGYIADAANLNAAAFQAGQQGYLNQANQSSSVARDAQAFGRIATGFSLFGRALTLYGVSQQPDDLTKGYAAFDGLMGEALTAEFGPAGTALSLGYNRFGGTQALAKTQEAAYMAQLQQTNAWICILSRLFK